jgi:hypothetical protein
MKKVVLCFLALAFVLSEAVSADVRATSSRQQNRLRIVKHVESMSGSPIYADNSQGSPIDIQEATVKEISGDDYSVLVGEPAKHFRQSTFPEVTILNTSEKTVRSFALVTRSTVEAKGYVLLKHNLSLVPNSSYRVDSSHWVKAERVTIKTGDKFTTVWRQQGLVSRKSWIPGACSDLKVTVGMVEFDDGTRWMIPSNSGW